MKFREYDTFRLIQPIPGEPISVGSIGAVLMVFPDEPPHYEVEFLDADGHNLGTSPTHTITEELMETVTQRPE